MAQVAHIAPKFAQLTQTVVYDDLWRRSDLTVRDRSLVTIAALAAMGDADQLPPYLHRAVAAGLTQAQIGEAMAQLAFYAGWPKAKAALEMVAETFPSAAMTTSGNFSGPVSVSGAFRGEGDATLAGATVSFAPASRTRWHSHPFGQLLIVTAGEGWTQTRGQSPRRLTKGEVVWTPPGVEHWHGASGANGMTHVAVAEEQPGRTVTWLDHVTAAEVSGLD
jgi:4-carboxymuconolactone decarboxylase